MALAIPEQPKQVHKDGQRVVACEFRPSDPFFGTIRPPTLKVLGEKCCAEACCLPNGSCENIPTAECLELGGTPQGVGTICTDPDINCDLTQACCFTDGSCVDVPPAECVALGGTPQGAETECLMADCGPCTPFGCAGQAEIITAIWSGYASPCCPGGGTMVNELEQREDLGNGFCRWDSEPLPFLVPTSCPPPADFGVISRILLTIFPGPRWNATVAISGPAGFRIYRYIRPCIGAGDGPQGTYVFDGGDGGFCFPFQGSEGTVEVT